MTHGTVTDSQVALLATLADDEPREEPRFPLPPYQNAECDLRIGNFDLDSSRQVINAAYAEAVHFRPNLFSVPSGATGEKYVNIIARLYQCFGDAAAGEGVSIKVAMVATQVLLQQPYRMVDSREHADCLQRRLSSWDTGDIDELMTEARTIQQQIREATNKFSREERAKDDSEARRFAALVMDGKIGSATRMLDGDSKGALHRLDNVIGDHTVREILREKHPAASPLNEDAVMDGEPLPQPHPVIFTALNRDVIRQAALRTHGAAGPSGMDAANWRKICTSFRSASDALCDALVTCARRIATKYVDPISLEAYVACRLVPLDKQPGVRPIGIGEVVRRILGKAILQIVGSAVESAVGCLQLCGGQECGVEAAIHAVKTTFDDDHTEGVLFADATNAFNRLNRAVCLRNVQRLCPELAPAVINTYRSPAHLYVGGEVILSSEGTTQGDPLAMPMYALGTVPLIREAAAAGAMQSWYADDATSAGALRRMRTWWSILVDRGTRYGYDINPSKSVLLVKPQHLALATELFATTGVNIRTDGYRHLGAALGSALFCDGYVSQKVDTWCTELQTLAKHAASQPQAAYAVLTHGLRHKWSFLARTMPAIADLLTPLENSISQVFLPALTGRQAPGEEERAILALPCRHGGLGILNPGTLSQQYDTSTAVTRPLVEQLL